MPERQDRFHTKSILLQVRMALLRLQNLQSWRNETLSVTEIAAPLGDIK
jgi:hypothetical protein